MRWLAIVAILICSTSAFAADDARQSQSNAAIAGAVERLLLDIESQPIAPGLTIGSLIQRTDTRRQLLAVLRQAQPIGGPRWIDPQTCQVRLDIPGPVVVQALQRIAADHPRLSPVGADELARDLNAWNYRVFSATGFATMGIDAIRPPPGLTAWRTVPPPEVRQALVTARQAAVQRVFQNVGPVTLAGSSTITDALALPPVNKSMTDWMESRPITQVEFREDRQVTVKLFVPAPGFCDNLRSALTGQTAVAQPPDDHAWSVVVEQVSLRMDMAIGSTGPAATRPQGLTLPPGPPVWIDTQLDAEGTGVGDGQLRSARAAQTAAIAKLREQVDKLPIAPDKTLADLAAGDPHVAADIDRVITRDARLYNVEYRPDGSASARMSLELRFLWEAISWDR